MIKSLEKHQLFLNSLNERAIEEVAQEMLIPLEDAYETYCLAIKSLHEFHMDSLGTTTTPFSNYTQERLFQLYFEGKNDTEISRIMSLPKTTSITQTQVRSWRKSKRLPKARLTEIEKNILKLYLLGLPDYAIADELKTFRSKIVRWREKNNFEENIDEPKEETIDKESLIFSPNIEQIIKRSQ
jgi:hypothetical protein